MVFFGMVERSRLLTQRIDMAKKKTPPNGKPRRSRKKPPRKVVGAEVREIRRDQIVFATYNPRVIDPYAAKGLMESIRIDGMVDLPIWNEQTGNLVGGHQRITQQDKLIGHLEYDIRVAVVNLDLQREKELNVRLNSQNIQGQYDIGLLDEMINAGDFDYTKAGFDPINLEQMYLDTGYDTDMFDKLSEPAQAEVDHAVDETLALQAEASASIEAENNEEIADFLQEDDPETEEKKIADIKEAKRKFAERSEFGSQGEFYFIVVFPSNESCAEFLEKTNLTGVEDKVSGPRLAAAVDIELETLQGSQPEPMKDMAVSADEIV